MSITRRGLLSFLPFGAGAASAQVAQGSGCESPAGTTLEIRETIPVIDASRQCGRCGDWMGTFRNKGSAIPLTMECENEECESHGKRIHIPVICLPVVR